MDESNGGGLILADLIQAATVSISILMVANFGALRVTYAAALQIAQHTMLTPVAEGHVFQNPHVIVSNTR
jgi:hypothetical protein